jgi:hypothetical protein
MLALRLAWLLVLPAAAADGDLACHLNGVHDPATGKCRCFYLRGRAAAWQVLSTVYIM